MKSHSSWILKNCIMAITATQINLPTKQNREKLSLECGESAMVLKTTTN
jgi:hypothetical protein